MHDPTPRVFTVVATFSRRERAIVGLELIGRLAAVATVPLWLLLLGAATRADVGETTGWSVLFGGLCLVALLPRVLRRWWRAAEPARQAALAERALPDLAGRLTTAVSLHERAQPQVSPAILEHTIAAALASLSALRPARLHPAAPGVRSVAVGVLTWLALGSAFAQFPGGPEALRAWWTGNLEIATLAALPTEQPPLAEIGDLTIRYVYPAYTGLEPYEVPNSSGEVHAPPGTVVEISARNAEPVEAVGLRLGGDDAGAGAENLEAQIDANDAEKRWVKATFKVPVAATTWRLVVFAAGEAAATPPFPVLPEPDLPPEVLVDGPGERLELDVDDAFDLHFSARDDFGVSKVRLEVDGRPATGDLWTSAKRTVNAAGDWRGTPIDLGLKPGDAVELRVAAFDNDAVSGSKKGTSRPIKVLIKGGPPKSLRPEEQEALIALLVDALAAHLEEPWPVGTASGEFARWGERLGERYAALLRFHQDHGEVAALGMLELAMLADALDRATETIRFTQVSFFANDQSQPSPDTLASLDELRAGMVASVEEAILAIDSVRTTAAYTRIEKGLPRFERIAQRFDDALAETPVDGARVADQLAALSAEIERAREAAGVLRPGGIRDVVLARTTEMSRLAARVSEALQGRDDATSRRLTARLAAQARDYAAVIGDAFARARKNRENLGQKMKDVIAELKEIEAAERLLATETQRAREGADRARAAATAGLWKDAERAAARLGSATQAWNQGLVGAGRPFDERTLGTNAQERAEATSSSLENRDLLGAWRNTQSTAMAWDQVARRYMLQYGGRAPAGPGGREIGTVNEHIDALSNAILRIEQADQQNAAGSGAAVVPLRPEQDALTQRFAAASEKARELAQEFPVTPSGLDEALRLGSERMTEAGESLGAGKAMSAEGAEIAAAGHVRDAIEALQRAQQQASRQQRQGESSGRGSGSGSSEGSGGEEEQEGQGEEEGEEGGGDEEEEGEDGGGGDDGDARRSRDIDLPSPEEFRTPEEYRQSLLEGMVGEVPEAYRALKKRYYEDLVQQ